MSSQPDWKDIGRSFSHAMKNAMNTLDFSELNQSIEKTVKATSSLINDKIQSYSKAKPSSIKAKYNVQIISDLEKSSSRKLKINQWIKNFGIFLVAFSLLLVLLLLVSLGRYALPGILGAMFIFIPGLIALIGGTGGMSSARKMIAYLKKFHLYSSVIGDRSMASLDSLSAIVPETKKETIATLKEMIADRFFLQGHINEKKETFYVTNEAYEASLLPNVPNQKSAKELFDEDPETILPPEVREVIRQGEESLVKIKYYNEKIPDPIITQKLSDLENNIRHILGYLEEHPENVDDTKNMTKYYLPTIDKLLDTYIELNAYPNPGENIRKSKKEIEDTLDTLNYAFAKLYDDLFQMTSIEVASDISVLETLLAKEGLTKEKIKVR
ncbi:5-bromo-4-chloroindolyl phosphate hydrolysis family protein [Dubosiella newyorkensis]|uniref:5-bromo-4-chloroindolyl phosphate hydrolysis protein n=1 Tax=Dubosiella newyorkensis TaxID=1862672 RepID=A0A1U7NQC1_9FIRM|nr:5-bromo-4-chloroindolyl phosphate hydrolysis family protein [Dubosiella newyorkensis]OLU47833.1 hypothetical protein BO225_01040 [Dubosiella newyorkensis]